MVKESSINAPKILINKNEGIEMRVSLMFSRLIAGYIKGGCSHTGNIAKEGGGRGDLLFLKRNVVIQK